jgi:hypothetical protein
MRCKQKADAITTIACIAEAINEMKRRTKTHKDTDNFLVTVGDRLNTPT